MLRNLGLVEALAQQGLDGEAKEELDALVVEGGLRSRAAYLRALLLVRNGSPYLGLGELFRARSELGTDPEVHAAFDLLEAEIYLSIDKPREVIERASKNEGGGAAFKVRSAEAMVMLGDYEGAWKVLGVLPDQDPLWSRPETLRAYAELLHQRGDYPRAAKAWEALAAALEGQLGQGLALFRSGQSYFKGGERKLALLLFRQLKSRYAAQEVGLRSGLRLSDYAVLSSGENRRLQAAVEYGTLAIQAPLRKLREEAAFKQALLYFLLHDNVRSVEFLMAFVRDFGSGSLRSEADYLLTELLPVVVEEHLSKGQEFEALILVEQNRELILSGVLSHDFLTSLARAFSRIGLLDRAYSVFLFIRDAAQGRPEAEAVYLPMVRVLLEAEEVDLVSRYAGEYLSSFPQGADAAEIFVLLLRGLYEAGRIEEARELLRVDYPRSEAVDLWAGRVLLASGELDGAAAFLAGAGLDGRQQQAIFMRAEIFFARGEQGRSQSLYEALAQGTAHGDQSKYRLGQIFSSSDRGLALKYFTDLVEEGRDPLWKRLAAEAAAELERKMRLEPKL